ncbi:MAG: SDR family oxidoreductase [Myxococcota bacterium]|nr:SDR family oxidoreductase [Myxococcota bacterium]
MSVLILGATSPIARAMAAVYAAEGLSLCVAARDTDEAQRIAADLELRHGVRAQGMHFDALDFESHPAFVEQVEQELGPIEVAFVAFGELGDPQQSYQDFAAAKRVIEVNYTGAASICEALAQRMGERQSGTIIGISSVAGERGRQSNYFYGSAKGAFTLYLQGLRNRMQKSKVKVITVKLGYVDTRMTYGLRTAIPIASPSATAKAIRTAQRLGLDSFYYPPFWGAVMGIVKAIPEGIFKRLSM